VLGAISSSFHTHSALFYKITLAEPDSTTAAAFRTAMVSGAIWRRERERPAALAALSGEGVSPGPPAEPADTRWYLERYEDARRSGVNPLVHYATLGSREGRNPGPGFETKRYLDANPDVEASGVNPLSHYLRHGRGKARDTTEKAEAGQ
jgi:hypothetical protein